MPDQFLRMDGVYQNLVWSDDGGQSFYTLSEWQPGIGVVKTPLEANGTEVPRTPENTLVFGDYASASLAGVSTELGGTLEPEIAASLANAPLAAPSAEAVLPAAPSAEAVLPAEPAAAPNISTAEDQNLLLVLLLIILRFLGFGR